MAEARFMFGGPAAAGIEHDQLAVLNDIRTTLVNIHRDMPKMPGSTTNPSSPNFIGPPLPPGQVLGYAGS
jgi:hypothetical protein